MLDLFFFIWYNYSVIKKGKRKMIEKILKVLTKENAIYLYEIINKNEIEIIMNDNEYSIYNFKRNEKGSIKVEKVKKT